MADARPGFELAPLQVRTVKRIAGRQFARFRDGAVEQLAITIRQTDSFNWDTNPHTPRLYFKSAPPLHLPRHNDLLGLHRLITGMEMYYASPVCLDQDAVGETLSVSVCLRGVTHIVPFDPPQRYE